ncbi:MAG TPA: SPFH domain-containing protein [Cyclobacteriaceae bacterium]|jgi:regulator of protease activity HflC (stomatin/prohibitin superfamily)|nr:SPFH domain-containing protein [Cytophagales bacterium]HNT50149.1 SPFH domain-containing protein [Cyclobacteriaceae bacterium]HRE66263.1 SPFH domain-containing protein [Cyclobacteriaceae bacterium]HRF34010.1 SPFH domain-containing protein [Cyclobacteriaceae bacterium]
MNTEKSYSPISGYLMVLVILVFILAGSVGVLVARNFHLFWFLGLGLFLAFGFFYVNPNDSVVLVLFGDYKGTVKQNGFYWVNPFFSKRHISLRARNFDSEKIKVNDKVGNPIQIGVILVWQVRDTFKAAFEVDNYEAFVRVQSDAAVRKLAGQYSYDNFDDESETTLRSGYDEVNHTLEENLRNRLEIAGINVIEARIGYLAYAPEIASAMLRRQQATAVVAARHKIVEGAVSMVEMALDHLSKKQIVELDEERKAAMVSNLMVVLCGDKDVSPVVNTGTLNH